MTYIFKAVCLKPPPAISLSCNSLHLTRATNFPLPMDQSGLENIKNSSIMGSKNLNQGKNSTVANYTTNLILVVQLHQNRCQLSYTNIAERLNMNVFLGMFQNMVDPSLNIFVLFSVLSGFIVGLNPWLLTANFTKISKPKNKELVLTNLT